VGFLDILVQCRIAAPDAHPIFEPPKSPAFVAHGLNQRLKVHVEYPSDLSLAIIRETKRIGMLDFGQALGTDAATGASLMGHRQALPIHIALRQPEA
jgi:hypothetical protein